MSVHKTSDGRWFVAYYPEGQDRTRAKRKYFGRGPQAKQAAEDWDYAFKRAKRSGDPAQTKEIEAEADGISFFEVAQKYLNQHPLSKSTRYSIQHNLNRHIADLFGQSPVSDLSMRNLAALDASMIEKGLKLATRNRVRAYCRAIMSWAVQNDLAKENPFAKFRQDRKHEGKAPDLVTEDELRAIWAQAVPHLRWTMFCLMNLGVRPGPTELFAIKVGDVDFSRQGVWVTRTKTHNPREMIPVLPDFLAAVREMLDGEPGRVFLIEYPTRPGEPVQSVRKAWGSAKRRAGITRRIRLYDIRHFFASKLLQNGADLKAVSEIMGHSSPNMTLQVYYHLLERQKIEAVSRLKLPDLASNGDT